MEAASTWQHEAMAEPVSPLLPPVAARRPAVLEAHGDRRIDPYFWLRQRANPEVIAYLEDENAYADMVMSGTRLLQERIYREITSRIKQSDTSAPSFFKGYWHYTRTVEGLNYEIHCRRRGSMEAPEEIELDGNALADGHEYFELGYVERSPDENMLAYAVDFSGKELHELRFRDLTTGEDIEDVIESVYYGGAWSGCSTRCSSPLRQSRTSSLCSPSERWPSTTWLTCTSVALSRTPSRSGTISVHDSLPGESNGAATRRKLRAPSLVRITKRSPWWSTEYSTPGRRGSIITGSSCGLSARR